MEKKTAEQILCRMISDCYGDSIDHLKQLATLTVSVEELLDICKDFAKASQLPVEGERWVSVSERLPEIGESIEVCYDTVVFSTTLERYTKEDKRLEDSLVMVTEEWFFWKDYPRYKTIDGVVVSHSSLGFPTVEPIAYWRKLRLPSAMKHQTTK